MLRAEPVEFTIDIKGELSGTDYKGYFSCLPVLSHRLTLQKDRKYRELLGDSGTKADEYAQTIAIYLADLSVRLTKYPEWWRGSDLGQDLEDFSVIQEIAMKVSEIITKHTKEIQDKADKAQKELKETK